MKRLSLIIAFGCIASLAWGANPVDDLVHQMQDDVKASKWDDAITINEKIIEEYPIDQGNWYERQVTITQMLIKKGDWDGAAKSAHLCVDGAPNPWTFDNAVNFAAQVLSAQDKNVDRANAFLNFENTGGADGKPNPFDAVGYPNNPARDAAFATMRQQAKQDAQGCRLRAFTYLFSGKPKDALANFADAFRRNENPYDASSAGVDLVAVGLRAAQGHRVGLDKAMQYVVWGPAGPDGKSGTADDLADPFKALMPPVPDPGTGGLEGLSPDDLAALQKVRHAALAYAGDPLLPSDGIRRSSLGALQRINDALDGWGAPRQKDWYVRLALGIGCLPPDEWTTGYLEGAERAARGRENNYGGVRALWAEIDSLLTTNKLDRPKHLDDYVKQFHGFCDNLAKMQFPKPAYGLMKDPAKF